ncbi:MAG: hypothetical protein H0U64_02000 [Gemmatimonadaceae bacterium]|nr:hypothetical protein [Gemmatimonadaceae bacterium]
MPVPKPKLRVLPNPWTYIDHKGRPAGRFPYETENGVASDGRTIGSHIASADEVKAATSVRIAGFTFQLSAADHDIQIAYSDEPTTVPNTPYYRKAIMTGQLIAADVRTANICGIPSKDFEGYAGHVDKKRDDAVAEFDAANGDGAFKHFETDRAESAKAHSNVERLMGSIETRAQAAATQVDSDKPMHSTERDVSKLLHTESSPAQSQAAEQAIKKGDK